MVFAVSDSGIGIASDQLPFVFDKFWQVDAARTRTQSGIGMGLYIVKAFTVLLGGTVSVNSTLNIRKSVRHRITHRLANALTRPVQNWLALSKPQLVI
jgi:signal transduction histidine kinase